MSKKRLDELILNFPGCAGELWVHVGESANYISSILSMYDVIPGCPVNSLPVLSSCQQGINRAIRVW